MKIAVIGCTHAGTAAATTIAKLYPDSTITVYERNDNVSFLSCGLALYVGGVVQDPQGLFYSSPEKMNELGITMKMQHDVNHIDTERQLIHATNLVTGEAVVDGYDKLVITTGSWPVTPPIKGIDLENVLLAKNFNQASTIIERAKKADRVTVVGAGYIGVELVEAFEKAGKQVTLIDGADRILNKYLDAEFTDEVETEFRTRGIELALSQTVERIEGQNGSVQKVVTDKEEYETDLVIMCVGFRPNTGLLREKVDMMDNGAITVDEYMRTSNPSIFAAGDCCAVKYNPTGGHAYIPLATNAVRMGTLAARNLMEPTVANVGTQGTSGLHIYDLNMASTGLTETSASLMGIHVKNITIEDTHRPAFMPTAENVKVKVAFAPDTRRLLGAQVISKADVTQAINTISVGIQQGMTIDELAFVDFFFQPHFNQPWNFLNKAGLEAIRTLQQPELV
ncbi:FAD-dependent oxidoreductase [Halobacillus naozhouensis]|uniref:FAD-dependent oxidoreductase n=1 Tax=Halobacillus naozhouensis TaxID=554880 RepID=A0ABY8J259_9BACI|nr:FAD-dependent oxidoreductase [Halobacillus naozhouensis]WFT75473.1 FAD-dependent oxidoreductase [Halobacillus naozhouensis]